MNLSRGRVGARPLGPTQTQTNVRPRRAKTGDWPRHTRCTGSGSGGVMYSKARVAGHPIHPMIVAFPIAFYTATVATLLAYVGTLEAFWYRVAMVANIAGIITAAIAVI